MLKNNYPNATSYPIYKVRKLWRKGTKCLVFFQLVSFNTVHGSEHLWRHLKNTSQNTRNSCPARKSLSQMNWAQQVYQKFPSLLRPLPSLWLWNVEVKIFLRKQFKFCYCAYKQTEEIPDASTCTHTLSLCVCVTLSLTHTRSCEHLLFAFPLTSEPGEKGSWNTLSMLWISIVVDFSSIN